MAFTDKQRTALLKLKGPPIAQVEFDVWADGSLSMWTHFNHDSDFHLMKKQVKNMRNHLDRFIKDSDMCPLKIKQAPELKS